jgi:hypothetical protein
VRQNLKREAVAASVAPYGDCKCSIDEKARELLLASLAQVCRSMCLRRKAGSRRAISAASNSRPRGWLKGRRPSRRSKG